MKTLLELLRTRLGRSIIRWVRVLSLSVVAAIVFELILSPAWSYISQVLLPYSPIFIGLVTWVLTLLLFYVVTEPLRIRKRQWGNMLRYPPVWSAVLIGWVIAAASERLPPSIRPQTIGPDWQHVYTIVPIVMALGIAVFLRQLPWRRTEKQPESSAVSSKGGITQQNIVEWISAGERPIKVSERDLFHHQPVASRIAHAVGREGRSVALLGRFGTGKTSILNLARAELGRFPPTVIVTDFDVWATPKPEDVPRLALNRIVAALDEHIDTTEFRDLPLAYQRLAAAEPTGRLAHAFGLETVADSLEEIERLTPILEVLNARLVLILEDVERAGDGFDTRHLQRFLWALRKVERASFILAADPDHARLDYQKLCDTIELVPPVEVEHTATIVKIAYDHWRTKFSYIDPHPNRREGDKLRLEHALLGGTMDYIQRTGRDTPLDALVSLLETPRALKHVLARVDQAWRNLHGEVELDDIILISALRHGAEPVYKFLIGNIDAARHKPDATLPRTTTVEAQWEKVSGSIANGATAQRLIDLLGIEQLTKGIAVNVTGSLQGVHENEPTDYFRRIVVEKIGPAELRDQTVLRDIERWQASRDVALVDKLVAASEGSEQYARVWEHFSFRHSEAELMELTERVVADVLERDGSSAEGDHSAMLVLWRRCNRRLPQGRFADWLQTLILSAVPVSLHFVNGLYYYWTGRHGIVTDTQRTSVRRSIIEAVRDTVRTGGNLAKVLATDHPYTVTRLITQTGADTGLRAFQAWRDYLPSVLIDGAKSGPEIIIPELATLAGDEQSGITAAGTKYPPVFINRYKIDRERMTALFEERLDEALALLAEYDGDNAYAVRAKPDAEAWLKERRSQQ